MIKQCWIVDEGYDASMYVRESGGHLAVVLLHRCRRNSKNVQAEFQMRMSKVNLIPAFLDHLSCYVRLDSCTKNNTFKTSR